MALLGSVTLSRQVLFLCLQKFGLGVFGFELGVLSLTD